MQPSSFREHEGMLAGWLLQAGKKGLIFYFWAEPILSLTTPRLFLPEVQEGLSHPLGFFYAIGPRYEPS